MPSSMVVHDTRLSGTAPAIAPNIYCVNGSTPLKDALLWIATYARMSKGLTQLSVMCHGYEGGVHDGKAGVSTMDLGFGLQLCREGAEVLAAVETQYYLKEPRAGIIKRLFRTGADDTINFGNWEGQLYRFSPDGSVSPTVGRW